MSGVRPAKIEMLIKQFDDAIEEDDFEKAERLLIEIEKELGEKNTEFRKLKTIFDDAKFINEL